jgi:hypothetical protein
MRERFPRPTRGSAKNRIERRTYCVSNAAFYTSKHLPFFIFPDGDLSCHMTENT